MIYVPFGSGCFVAESLKLSGKRKQAFPFDWCIVDISQIGNIIEHIKTDIDDFIKYMFSNIERCKWCELEKYNNCEYGDAFHTIYNLTYPHHNLFEQKDTIIKRLYRFRECIGSDITYIISDKFCYHSYNDIEYNNMYDDDIQKLEARYNIITASYEPGYDLQYVCNDNWRTVSEQLVKELGNCDKFNNI